MYFQEKQTIMSIISSVLITGAYWLYVITKYQEQILNNPNDFSFWGTAMMIMIPVAIIAQIIIHIVFVIINKIVANEDMPTITDERDKLIELKSIRISHWVFIFGFLLAMGSQAMKMQPYVMFIVLISSCFIASIMEGIAKIYLYRKGF